MAEKIVLRVPIDQFDQEVQDYRDSGFRVRSRKENEVILAKSNGWGSLFVHIMLIALTAEFMAFGLIPNILYAFSHHKVTKLYIRVQNESNMEASSQLKLSKQISEPEDFNHCSLLANIK